MNACAFSVALEIFKVSYHIVTIPLATVLKVIAKEYTRLARIRENFPTR